MQGRFSNQYKNKIQNFPKNTWKKEFEYASNSKFEIIEWIFDEIKPNPILNSEGVNEINKLMKKFDIKINSICADYFMIKKLFNESETKIENNIKILEKLILQANKLEISNIEIPLVDSSSLKNDNDKEEIKNNLNKIISLAEKNNITIVLETDLNPHDFREFLIKFDHPCIMANYDSGNSTALNYNLEEELKILKKWIKNVHIKDRKINGGTVPLGNGDTNFEQLFSTLSKINYSGDLIIQGARQIETEIDPKYTCELYQKLVKQYVDKYYI
jgi:L-ribulose-5-phosphate 3-epimerase